MRLLSRVRFHFNNLVRKKRADGFDDEVGTAKVSRRFTKVQTLGVALRVNASPILQLEGRCHGQTE